MQKRLIICLISLSLTSCQSVSQIRTDFPANDKKQHYEAGYLIGMFSLPVIPLGLLGGVLAGGGKEIYDCFSAGHPEWKDFEYTAEGSWDGYLHTWERSFYGIEE